MVASRRFACTAALLQIPTVDYDDPVNSAHSCRLTDTSIVNFDAVVVDGNKSRRVFTEPCGRIKDRPSNKSHFVHS
jgi:hypothetical protein